MKSFFKLFLCAALMIPTVGLVGCGGEEEKKKDTPAKKDDKGSDDKGTDDMGADDKGSDKK